MPRRRRLARGPLPVWILTGLLAAITVVGLDRLAQHGPELPAPSVPWWVLAIPFGLAEVFLIHVRIGRDAQSLSLSELSLVIGMAYAAPSALILAQVVGVGAALTLHRRQTPIRTAFNLAQRSTTATLAIALFGALHAQLGSSCPAICVAARSAPLA